MTPDPLNFLVELREAVGLTQKEVARRFGLAERQGYKSVAAWEKGESIPKERLRGRFLRYLWDDLRLHKEPTRFAECWAILVERWHWEPLSDVERADLRLPLPSPDSKPSTATTQPTTVDGAVIGGNVTTNGGAFTGRDQHNYILLFSQLYQQANATVDATKLATAITEYLEWLVDGTRSIELRGIPARGNVVSLPLDEIFVPLQAKIADQRHNAEKRAIRLDQVLTVGEQLAVIGGPGSGKSTVLQYIAWVLARALLDSNAAWAEQKLGLRLAGAEPLPPLPLYLPLSAYARLRFRSGKGGEEITFPEFIQHYLKQSHCNIGGLPPDFFVNLLQSGRRVILLLDGLDEVANEQDREVVTQTIERMVRGAGRKQQLRVVVTCRSVAYKGQAILTHGFRQVTVQPLDDNHVEQLVRQAYAAVYNTNRDEQDTRTAELLAGIARLEGEHARRLNTSDDDDDDDDDAFAEDDGHQYHLINSPLLVRMLLVVHLNDRKLPQHRADLYRRFVDTILNSEHVEDRLVANELSTLPGNNLALMSHLAFAMHKKGKDQGREIELDVLQELLKPDYTAESAAFVALIHLRGTLVEERNGSYRFIHLAFQEYLAARYLAQDYWRNEGMKQTFHFIAQQTPNSWWREVATLLPGYLREESPLNAKRVINALAALNEWQTLAVDWSPDVQLAASEIAATATLEWFHDDPGLRQAVAQRLLHFFNTPALLNQTQPRLRALAGRALAALGDPRFRADAWYLPDDPMLGFVEIPAGTFIMGSDKRQDQDAEDDETPQHAVTLPAFYIARYPVTVAQFRAFVEDTGEQPSYADSLTDPDNHPVRYVTWFEATRYCQWLTEQLRTWDKTPGPLAEKLAQGWQVLLPSEAEWERAARGREGRLYPWGNEAVDLNRANYKETGIETTTVVGCFPAGATPEGIEDLSGNVWEWTRNRSMAYPYPSDEQGRREREKIEIEGVKWDDQFVQRGGAYWNDKQNMRAPLRSRYDALLYYGGGFRVVVGGGAAPGS